MLITSIWILVPVDKEHELADKSLTKSFISLCSFYTAKEQFGKYSHSRCLSFNRHWPVLSGVEMLNFTGDRWSACLLNMYSAGRFPHSAKDLWWVKRNTGLLSGAVCLLDWNDLAERVTSVSIAGFSVPSVFFYFFFVLFYFFAFYLMENKVSLSSAAYLIFRL